MNFDNLNGFPILFKILSAHTVSLLVLLISPLISIASLEIRKKWSEMSTV